MDRLWRSAGAQAATLSRVIRLRDGNRSIICIMLIVLKACVFPVSLIRSVALSPESKDIRAFIAEQRRK
jgi:hypothetical protein